MAESDRESNKYTRPLPHEILLAFNDLFRNELTIATLREAIINGSLGKRKSQSDVFAPGRSFLWKLFLMPESPLVNSRSVTATACLPVLRSARITYADLASLRLRPPDGTSLAEFRMRDQGSGDASPRELSGQGGGWEKNNPLSLDARNPWQQWFADYELRKVIRQDVDRIFPEVPYFLSSHIHERLTDILFLYSITHAHIGYRQGMHELCGAILLAVDTDSLSEDCGLDDEELIEFCAREHVSADVFALFSMLMKGAARWYDWRNPEKGAGGGPELQKWEAPVIHICRRIQDQELRSVDPALWAHLSAVGIEPQIYGIRWLRLMFTREFDMRNSMAIWDCLFAADASLDLAEWICVAMLLRIRNHLFSTEDYTTILTYLLRYPATEDLEPSLLVRQAMLIRENPVPAAGVTVMLQNRDKLGIPIEMKSPQRPEHIRMPVMNAIHKPERGAERTSMGLSDIISRNLLERADTTALNRVFASTVAELRKGLPDLASNISRSFPTQVVPLGSPPVISNSNLPTGVSEQLWRNRSQTEDLARALTVALHTLQEADVSSDRRDNALRSIEHVRDILLDRSTSNSLRQRTSPSLIAVTLPASPAGPSAGDDPQRPVSVDEPEVRTLLPDPGSLASTSTVSATLPRVPYMAKPATGQDRSAASSGSKVTSTPVVASAMGQQSKESRVPSGDIALQNHGKTRPAEQKTERSLDPLGALRG